MYDLHRICESADSWGKLFNSPDYFECVVRQSNCAEIDIYANLLEALDFHNLAAELMGRHLDSDGCEPNHLDTKPPIYAVVNV